MSDVIDRPIPAADAPGLIGTSGFFCEHEATDRMGIPVKIDPAGVTVWEPAHLHGTDGSVETTPTADLTFWLQATPLDEFRRLLGEYGSIADLSRRSGLTRRAIEYKRSGERRVTWWDVYALERLLQIKEERP